MNQAADLYTILRFYASRVKSPSFTVEAFIGFLEKYAKRYMAERPDLAPWATDTARLVQDGLPSLAEAGKCQLSMTEKGQVVMVNQYFVDLIQQAYRNLEEMPERPFPDETNLKVMIPQAHLRNVSLELDFEMCVNEPQGAQLPILKLGFPDGVGSLLLLSSMIPKKILELAFLKARHYLRTHNNKEYVLHKLAPAFQGKEPNLKDAVNQLMVRPFDSIIEMEKAGDFSFPFWAYFTSLVKGDIRKKNERLPEDTAVIQAVLLIEFFNNFYKSKAQKAKEAETALRNLDVQLDKPPYYYTIDDIVRFVDTKGVPLLGQYAEDALQEFIREKTTKTGGLDQLPELLIVRGLHDERWYVKKKMLLPLCVKLLGEARPRVKTAVTQDWFKLMKDFRTNAAMEEDEAFNRELEELTVNFAPVLAALLREKILYLVHEELDGTEAGIPEASRLFYKGALAPMGDLYLLSRKDLLIDVRMLLPFWYTIPFISGIISFFKNLFRKKPRRARKETKEWTRREIRNDEADATEAESETKEQSVNRKKELKKAARIVQKRLVPEGYSLDGYLVELEERWNRIINPQAKANLTEDVKSLIRDYLRKTARSLRAASFTPERIDELARTLADSPNLLKIQAREALKQYIQVYMVKLVLGS